MSIPVRSPDVLDPGIGIAPEDLREWESLNSGKTSPLMSFDDAEQGEGDDSIDSHGLPYRDVTDPIETYKSSFTASVEVRKPVFFLQQKINSLVKSNPLFFTEGWINRIKNPIALIFTVVTVSSDVVLDLVKLVSYFLLNIALFFTLVGYAVKDSLQNKGILEKKGIERLKEDMQNLQKDIQPEKMPSLKQIEEGKKIIVFYQRLKREKGEETFLKLDTLAEEAVLVVLQVSFLVSHSEEMREILENDVSSVNKVVCKLEEISEKYKELFSVQLPGSDKGLLVPFWNFYKEPSVLGSSSPNIEKNIKACNSSLLSQDRTEFI